jgi:hypothetical protein
VFSCLLYIYIFFFTLFCLHWSFCFLTSEDMLSGKLNSKAKGRNPTNSLAKALPNLSYPPELTNSTEVIQKMAPHAGESAFSKRPPAPASNVPKKARVDPPGAGPNFEPSGSRPSASFLGTIEGDTAISFIESLVSVSDQARLGKLSDTQLIAESCVDLSRVCCAPPPHFFQISYLSLSSCLL